LSDLSSIVNTETEDVGRKGFHIKKIIEDYQSSMTAPEIVNTLFVSFKV
jgi:hypothetical protein